MENDTVRYGGAGFGEMLTVAFIVLKLCGVIDWSWWKVLSPLWIIFGLVLGVLAIAGIINGIELLLDRRDRQ